MSGLGGRIGNREKIKIKTLMRNKLNRVENEEEVSHQDNVMS